MGMGVITKRLAMVYSLPKMPVLVSSGWSERYHHIFFWAFYTD